MQSKSQTGSSSFNHDKYQLPLNHIRAYSNDRLKEDVLKSSVPKQSLQKLRTWETKETLILTKNRVGYHVLGGTKSYPQGQRVIKNGKLLYYLKPYVKVKSWIL
jgi:hypothetical protein